MVCVLRPTSYATYSTQKLQHRSVTALKSQILEQKMIPINQHNLTVSCNAAKVMIFTVES